MLASELEEWQMHNPEHETNERTDGGMAFLVHKQYKMKFKPCLNLTE